MKKTTHRPIAPPVLIKRADHGGAELAPLGEARQLPRLKINRRLYKGFAPWLATPLI
ncbi:unnamed protein product [marine sediment metagenome]|uniref:Uncharacterized protein n=1 Tax=marine sediment metagenome TaxID=412755 RepID=X0YSK7_9ZZZZ